MMVTESSVPIFSQAFRGTTLAPAVSAEAKACSGRTAHFRKSAPPVKTEVIRNWRRSNGVELISCFTMSSVVLIAASSLWAGRARFNPFFQAPNELVVGQRRNGASGARIPRPAHQRSVHVGNQVL